MLGLGLGIGRGFLSVGGAVAPSYTPPLDTYTGATAAYSVRKLSSSYSGPCIEAYRVSDGATQDIGFDGDGLIDTAAIVTFASGGEVRVRTWYDQSGNASDAVQTTASRMPQVYDGASVITEDGQPALKAQDDWFVAGGGAVTGSGMLASVSRHTGLSFQTTLVWDQRVYYTGNGGISMRGNSGTISGTVSGTTSQNLITAKFDDTNAVGRFNGSQFATGATGTTATISAIFSRVAGLETSPNAVFQEMVWWSSWDTSDTLGLEVNINDYYQIANLPASSSGLLYDYPDAAAAYSVRSLSNNAIKCMRVRRDNDDAELDIGFDGDGNLDTAAIATHCGVNNGYVSKWYDQSGNSNDAAQATFGSQPQIYNGTAVVTENGKPILIGGQLNYGSTITYTNNLHSVFNVLRYDANAIYASSYNSGITNHYSANFRSGLAFEKVGGLTGYHGLGASPSSGAQQMVSIIDDATNVKTNVNGISSSVSSIGPYTAVTTLTHRGEFSLSPDVKIQEQLVYLSDQTTNRTAIESNINDYYSIYT